MCIHVKKGIYTISIYFFVVMSEGKKKGFVPSVWTPQRHRNQAVMVRSAWNEVLDCFVLFTLFFPCTSNSSFSPLAQENTCFYDMFIQNSGLSEGEVKSFTSFISGIRMPVRTSVPQICCPVACILSKFWWWGHRTQHCAPLRCGNLGSLSTPLSELTHCAIG